MALIDFFKDIPDSELDLLIGKYASRKRYDKTTAYIKVIGVQRIFNGKLALRGVEDYKHDPHQVGSALKLKELTFLEGKPVEYWEPNDSSDKTNRDLTDSLFIAVKQLYPDAVKGVNNDDKEQHRYNIIVRRNHFVKNKFVVGSVWQLSDGSIQSNFFNANYDYSTLHSKNIDDLMVNTKFKIFLARSLK